MLDMTGSLGILTALRRLAPSRQGGVPEIVSSVESTLTSSGGGPAFRHSAMSSGSRHDHGDHEGHDHGDHEGHDHAGHEGHDHAGHDHGDHEGHDHGDHEGHDHDDHAGHDHDDHAGHDHDDHEGHDHDDHEGHDHDDHEGHDHDDHAGHGHHDHAHDLRGTSRRSLIVALALITTYMFAEVIGGILSGSLALIADAGHMATDAAAILMALIAMWIAERAATTKRTFGYQRTEVLAALLNTLALWLIAGWIVYEAYHRITEGEVHVDGWPVLFVGIGGLLVNIAAAWILHRSSEHSMNVEGAFQHVLADLMGSVGVVISAIVVLTVGWQIVDPILSVLIALLILYSSRHLMVQVINVLLEGVPGHIDVYRLCSSIEDLEGVTIIHDVHVWTITSGSEAFSAHVLIDPAYPEDDDHLLSRMLDIVHEEFGIDHATIQLERSARWCDKEDHHVDHLLAESGQYDPV